MAELNLSKFTMMYLNPSPLLAEFPRDQFSDLCSFSFFINDLPSIFLDSIPWLFADDLKLLFNSLNFHVDLARLSNWNIMNGMIANQIKTKCLPLAGKLVVYLNSPQPLEKVQLHKDLGNFIAGDLECPNHVEIQLAKARKAFYSLKYRIPFNTPSETKLNLYSSFVYNSSVRNPYLASKYNANERIRIVPKILFPLDFWHQRKR